MYGSLHYSGLGVPSHDTLAQFTSPSFVESPPHRISLNYAGLGAPGFDTLSQFSTPSYVETPPHRIPLNYGVPYVPDMAREGGYPGSFGPPHRIRLGYGAAESWLEPGKTYNLKGDLYTYNAQNSSFDVIPIEGSAYTLTPSDSRYQSALQALREKFAPDSEKKSGGGGFLNWVKNLFTPENARAAGTAMAQFKAGQAGAQAGNTPPPPPTFMEQYGTAIAAVAAAGVIGTVMYFALRSSPEAGEQFDRLALRNNGKRRKKAKSKAKSKSKSKARR